MSQAVPVISHSLPHHGPLGFTRSPSSHCLYWHIIHHARCTLRSIRFYPNRLLLFSQISALSSGIGWAGGLPSDSGGHFSQLETAWLGTGGESKSRSRCLLCQHGPQRSVMGHTASVSPHHFLSQLPQISSGRLWSLLLQLPTPERTEGWEPNSPSS